MSTTKKRKTKHNKRSPLPKTIRDELRITCAMKGYSNIKSGKTKKISDQQEELYTFFHEKGHDSPSQIGLLAKGQICYKELYEQKNVVVTSKKGTNSSVLKRYLKTSLTQDTSRLYYIGEDIFDTDLEKKN